MAFKSPLRGIQAWRRRQDLVLGGAAAEWTPASATSDGGYLPAHWYRSDGPLWQDAGITPATADGAVVGRWEDKTANRDHINQAVAANKPTLENAAGDLLNGYPVIRADGTNDYLKGAFTTGGAMTQPLTVFMVFALDVSLIADGLNHYILESDDAANRMGHIKNIGNNFAIYAGNTLTDGAASSAWLIWTTLLNGVTSRIWHNGVSVAGPGNAGAHNPDGLTVFAYNDGSLTTKGNMAEIIMYGANLNNADKNQVGRYLATRYGLAYTDI